MRIVVHGIFSKFSFVLKKKWKRCAASVVGAYNPLQSQLNLVGTAVEFYSRDESFRVPSSPARLGRSPITYDMPLLRVRRRFVDHLVRARL